MIITDSKSINHTAREYPKDQAVHTFFEEMAKLIPDKIAVTALNASVTYDELNANANKLARTLLKHGAGAGDIIAIQMERSIEMMTAILAVLKIGAAYLPLDTDTPIERLKYIISDANAKVLLTLKHLSNKHDVTIALNMDELILDSDASDLKHPCSSSSLAYIIYTSGSTGKPKGVMIRHFSVVNRILWMAEKYSFSSKDIFIQKTSYTFDVSVWEIFLWFFIGARLHLLPHKQESNVECLVSEIEGQQITVCHFVPSMLNVFLNFIDHRGYISRLGTLKTVFTSGEALQYTTARRFFELLAQNNETQLHNLYGPTEATVDVTYFDCAHIMKSETQTQIPIGRPIWNTQIYILNEDRLLCLDGETGEICISGDGVAAGYLNNDTLTETVFVEDPWSPGRKMYLTGDLGRWNNGYVEFLGRRDQQLKIRGNRVEPEEIESYMNQIDGVYQSVVVARDINDSEKRLEAYYLSDSHISSEQIASFLSLKLPDYMIPSVCVQVKEFLYTSSGKLDRKRMLQEWQTLQVKSESISDTGLLTTLTKRQKEIFSMIKLTLESLSVSDASVEMPLTDARISSLTFVWLTVKLEEAFNFEFDNEKLLNTAFPTIMAMIDYIENKIS